MGRRMGELAWIGAHAMSHVLFIVAVVAIAIAVALLLAVLAVIWATQETISVIRRYLHRRSDIEQRIRRGRARAEQMYGVRPS